MPTVPHHQRFFIGQVFGRLTVLALPCKMDGEKYYRVYCRCECGKEYSPHMNSVLKGTIKSCGCLSREITSARGTLKGLSVKHPNLFYVWYSMQQRCCNPQHKAWPDYGGRGITVNEGWKSFEPFLEWALANGYTQGLDIDRIDNNDGYSPKNCRWVTRQRNLNNKRNTVRITAWGETKSLSEWLCDERCSAKSRHVVARRLKSGLTPELAISTVNLKTQK